MTTRRSHQRAGARLRPRLARARLAAPPPRRDGGERIEIPLRIGGRDVRTGAAARRSARTSTATCSPPSTRPARPRSAGGDAAAAAAWREWSRMPWEERAAVFLRAADLLAGPWRDTVNAATMLGQSKTCYQAEIDAACELIDFWRFNVALHAAASTPSSRSRRAGSGTTSSTARSRASCFAVTPFNFTSIGGNLPTAPALMGNTVRVEAGRDGDRSRPTTCMRLLEEAGLPPGVINFVPGSGGQGRRPGVRPPATSPGMHFTGSTAAFQRLWRHDRRATSPTTAPTRASSARRAARTSSSPTRPPTPRRWRRRWCAAPSSTRGRSARRPRAPTCRARCGARCATGMAARSGADQDGRRRATSATSWAR